MQKKNPKPLIKHTNYTDKFLQEIQLVTRAPPSHVVMLTRRQL